MSKANDFLRRASDLSRDMAETHQTIKDNIDYRMTKDEFEVKEIEWVKRIEDLLTEVMKARNHKNKLSCTPSVEPVLKWFEDSIESIRAGFNKKESK